MPDMTQKVVSSGRVGFELDVTTAGIVLPTRGYSSFFFIYHDGGRQNGAGHDQPELILGIYLSKPNRPSNCFLTPTLRDIYQCS